MNPTSSEPIARVLAAYQAAVYAKDLGAFAALYAEDVHVFDMWGSWEYQGLPAWRGMAQGWFASLGEERVRVGVSGLRIQAGADLAAAQAYLTFTAESATGEDLRSLDNRISIVLRRSGGDWKIVQEHTSAPVDFETGKVMLRREVPQR